MIEDGEIYRQLKKSIKIYEKRRLVFSELLDRELGDAVEFDVPSGGLAVWMKYTNPVNLLKIREFCLRENLFIPRFLLYQNPKITAMRLGFGHLNETEMEQTVQIMKQALHEN